MSPRRIFAPESRLLDLPVRADPAFNLSLRTQLGLISIAQIFDSITNLLIEDHAARETVEEMGGPLPDPASSPRKPAAQAKEMRASVRRALLTAYPPLSLGATIGNVLKHIADDKMYQYWVRCCGSGSGPGAEVARTMASLREEALDLYLDGLEELEESESRVLLDASNAIRLKLRAVESPMTSRDIKHGEIPSRRIRKREPAKTETRAFVVNTITSVVTSVALIPVGLAWWRAETDPALSRTWISGSSSRTR
ncbi:hypothetical protein QBC35DRAFT_510089 [Podospora australis]|uniref:Uncharacterized protein n=1 Tax=Podospora australis TaxID=1536484 RepID=A0AAN6WJ54_9PEZI|nr:hypothetical protein QBC35DRAFT_510089 [Podospora australis]